jgi:hypothetical protein
MPQGFDRPVQNTRPNPFRLRQDLGYIPARAMAEGDGGGGITSTGGPTAPVLTLTPIALGDFLANLGGANPDIPVATSFVFTNLQDAPHSYTGHALQFVRVNAAANALEFANVSVPTSQWLPLVSGAEPASFITDGQGNLITVAYPL